METEINLPPEFEPLLQLLERQPESVRAIFHFAMVLMMIDDEKARVMETYVENGQTIWLVQTIAGDIFTIVRPSISEEMEASLLEQVRQIVSDETERGGE